jgi:hypothetical protein
VKIERTPTIDGGYVDTLVPESDADRREIVRRFGGVEPGGIGPRNKPILIEDDFVPDTRPMPEPEQRKRRA